MTTPVDPASVAPVTPPAPPVDPAAPPTPPAPGAPATPPVSNPWDTPDSAKAEIERLRRENGTERVNAKAQAAEEARAEFAQTVGKALGLVKDEPIDPKALADQAATATAEARTSRQELAVFRAATGLNADAIALLDSRSFMAKLADVDPSDHLAVAAAVGEAVAGNPGLLKTAPSTGLPAYNPAQNSSAGGPPDLEAQIQAAQKAGDMRTAIHLQNQKLSAPPR